MNAEHIGWAHIASLLLGSLLIYFFRWLAKWLDSKGADFLKAEMEKLRVKANENSLLGQIKADDAVITILEKAMPEAVHTLSDELKASLAAGNLDKVPWNEVGTKMWTVAEPQITGGVHDYLKSSSFTQDGGALAAAIAKRYFAAQKLAKDGVLVPKA